MIKNIIQIIAVVLVILWICEFKIGFKPFTVAMPNWRVAVAVIFICVGLSLYYNAAFRKGKKEMLKEVFELMDKYKKEKQ